MDNFLIIIKSTTLGAKFDDGSAALGAAIVANKRAESIVADMMASVTAPAPPAAAEDEDIQANADKAEQFESVTTFVTSLYPK